MIVSFPETVKLPASGGKVSITAQPFKRLRGSPESRDEKDMRLRATHVKAWMNFTLSNLQASCAGLQLEGIGDDAMRVTTMEDILFDRRTGTLARISSLTMYTRWASSHRLIASHSFWLLYARSRHWDSEFIIKEPSIEGRYVEASTSRTKTSNRRGRRNKATVLVVVCIGLLLRPWAEAWLELRKEILLCATGDQPLLPGVASDGSWSASAVESGAFCTHLRDLLPRHGVPASMLWNIGSHSWNEVIGEGRFLPYESRSGYSREEPEEPNVELVLVPNEDQVDDMKFSPCDGVSTPRLSSIGPPSFRDCEDSPQDGWEIVDTVGLAAESEPTSPESDDSRLLQSSSSSGEVAEICDSKKAGDQVSDADDSPKLGVERAPAPSSYGTGWVNANTMRLHFGSTGDVNLLACGRPLGPQRIEIALHLAFVPGNPRSASVCAVLGYEEMLTSFFEVFEPNV
jgi:hypothetical protein